MSPTEKLHQQKKINARDAANRLLGKLTVGAVLGAVAGVGILGYVSAETIPGNASSAATAATASTAATSSAGSSSSSSDSSSSTDSGLSAGSASSSSGSAVAVTGGS